LDTSLKKAIEEKFSKFFNEIIYKIMEEELSSTKIKKGKRFISLNKEDLYEDWIENVENVNLPEIEKVEENFHKDGIHIKVIYSMKVKNAKLVRKIKIKSNGNVNVENFIFTSFKLNGKDVEIKIEYDNFGHLIFHILDQKLPS
jgi:hypothetical protein